MLRLRPCARSWEILKIKDKCNELHLLRRLVSLRASKIKGLRGALAIDLRMRSRGASRPKLATEHGRGSHWVFGHCFRPIKTLSFTRIVPMSRESGRACRATEELAKGGDASAVGT